MTAPVSEAAYEPLSPVDVERRLRKLHNDLAMSQRLLREARDAEVTAKHVYERAHRKALLSPDCPKVTRGGYTTAERDAHVDERCAEQQEVHDLAEAKRKAAEDHLRVVRDQSMILMALGKSVNAAYAGAGVSG